MLRPDVLVLGVGRTGTSTAGRILFEHFGVCMGHRLYPRNAAQPQGTFEDSAMLIPTHRLVGMLAGSSRDPEHWLAAYAEAHKDCTAKLKGCKVTHMSLATREQLEHIAPKLIVRTWRPMDLAVRSLLKHRSRISPSATYWRVFYKTREKAMDAALDGIPIPVCEVRYFRELADEELVMLMAPHVTRALYT